MKSLESIIAENAQAPRSRRLEYDLPGGPRAVLRLPGGLTRDEANALLCRMGRDLLDLPPALPAAGGKVLGGGADERILLQREGRWWIAELFGTRGAVSQGRTPEEAVSMVLDAARELDAARKQEKGAE